MAPVKPKGASAKSKSKGNSKVMKQKSSAKVKKSAPIKTTAQKTKSVSHKPEKKKKRVYTDKELDIPALNGIRPAGVVKQKGMKKGKTFVDDKEGMMAILSMVQAEKEGDLESKMMKARHLEEIREAKRQEAEKREEGKRQRLEEVKNEVRKGQKDKKRRKSEGDEKIALDEAPKKSKKRVSFG
ncbi:putative 60S ribosomal subunit assembly/export protein loc1 [Elsinoe fawcettii]|nr:putative 60S ribosomal subunit assembly/export protein loc1 [Elsinoe fawcettii]